jgi:hypothetical protein
MAFHLHLIDMLRDFLSRAAPQLHLTAGAVSESRRTLRWEIGADGDIQSRWILV